MSANVAFLQNLPNYGQEQLSQSEIYWRDHQMWLASCGYMLRPRYAPDWKPSWEGTKKSWWECEDGPSAKVRVRQGSNHLMLQNLPKVLKYTTLLDATRISDGRFVFLKIIKKSVHPFEEEIGRFFSSDDLASDHRNHSVPILEVLQIPDDEDKIILVMPFLREFYNPKFDTIGEVVEFFRQAFEAGRMLPLPPVYSDV